MIQRIQKILRYKNLTPSRFADQVGVPRSTVSHILSERNKPSLEVIQKILDAFPEIQTQWLVRGEGQMVKGGHTLFPDEDFDAPQKDISSKKEGQKTSGEEKETPSALPSQEKKIGGQEVSSGEILKGEEDINREKETAKPEQAKETGGKTGAGEASSEGHIVRVLVFYANGRFREYFPAE